MTNATQNSDNPTQIDHTDDASHVTRPEWMNAEQWARIEADAARYIAGRVDAAAAARECDRDWCTIVSDDEHAEYHAGEFHPLSGQPAIGPDYKAVPGWGVHISQDRGDRVMLVFELEPGTNGTNIWPVPAAHVAIVLGASETPEARTKLSTLLAQVEHDDDRTD